MGKEIYWLIGVLGTFFVLFFVANRGLTPPLSTMKQNDRALVIWNNAKLGV